MFNKKKLLLAAVLMSALNAQAGIQSISADGLWHEFDVDDLTALSGGLEWIDYVDGSPLTFEFTLSQPAVLDVVDAGFSGDQFSLSIQAGSDPALVFQTSSAVNSYPNSIGLDFDAAFADSDFSKFSIALAPDTYTVTGSLSQSALDDAGIDINATVGGIRITSVPLPAVAWLFVTGIAAMGFASRRRQSK